MNNNSKTEKRSDNIIFRHLGKLFDTRVELDLRITMILAMSGAIANTLGFLSNLFLYGMTIPTVFCMVCALIIIWIYFFGLTNKRYKIFGGIILVMLNFFEFPLLILVYGAVMFPYLVIGFLALLMITKGKTRIALSIVVCLYDVGVIIYSSMHPYLFGVQEASGLMGSAIITYLITLGALTGCVISWQGVAVIETSDIDEITGALTRSGFVRNAKAYLNDECETKLSILFFDVKNFKVVNSVYGIEGGNNLLKQISEMLKNSFLQPIFVARLNADHFVCLVESDNVDYERIEALCSISYKDKEREMPFSMQCGIFPINDRKISVESMCDRAQITTLFIKNDQSTKFQVYNESVDLAFREENEILGELEKSICDRVFEPFFQPIVDCKTKKIASAEALARWIHPEKGIISPGVFIPVLEKKRLITELDEIIFSKVSELIETRVEMNKAIVPISVNLSRIDLYDKKMMESIENVLKRSNSCNHVYRFELTESVYELLSENSISILKKLKQFGAKILIDDFGSGYSSFGMIADYDFDIIKLDMEFALRLDGNPKVRRMVQSLIEMAHNLGVKVIAEGVETQSQFDFLENCGCDYVQGYLFYKPLSMEEFVAEIDRQN